MKKENILRAVRIIVLVIFCLFAAKVFIGKNGNSSNNSNLSAASKNNKVSEKNSTDINSRNSSKNNSKKKKENPHHPHVTKTHTPPATPSTPPVHSPFTPAQAPPCLCHGTAYSGGKNLARRMSPPGCRQSPSHFATSACRRLSPLTFSTLLAVDPAPLGWGICHTEGFFSWTTR